MIDISALNRAAVLAALYNASKPQGMGFMQFDPKPMTVDRAAGLLGTTTYFDYLKGRVMKVSLGGVMLDPRLYDRDNGDGAAQRAIDALRSGGENAPGIAQAHKDGTKAAARVLAQLDRETTIKQTDGITVVSLGLSDIAGPLGRAANEAMENP